jgi:hypothetical protein
LSQNRPEHHKKRFNNSVVSLDGFSEDHPFEPKRAARQEPSTAIGLRYTVIVVVIDALRAFHPLDATTIAIIPRA